MQILSGICRTNFFEISGTFFMPVVHVRWAVGLFRCAGENDVGDFQITFWPTVWGGFGVDGLGHQE